MRAPTACAVVVELGGRVADRRVLADGVLDADRQRDPHRRDLAAERTAVPFAAHEDRHERAQQQALGVDAAVAQEAAERARHDRQHRVVDGAAERSP